MQWPSTPWCLAGHAQGNLTKPVHVHTYRRMSVRIQSLLPFRSFRSSPPSPMMRDSVDDAANEWLISSPQGQVTNGEIARARKPPKSRLACTPYMYE